MNESLTPIQQSETYTDFSGFSGAGDQPTDSMYEQHPLSAAFPAMSEEELQNLKDSIDVIGVQNPIVIYEGKIIDGWHRYKVATELGMPCPAVHLAEDIDPQDFVLANNKARRHLNRGQIAIAYTKVYQWYPAGKPTSKGVLSTPLKTRQELAKLSGTSESSIAQAKSVLKNGAKPVQEAVQSGKISLKRGAKIPRLDLEKQVKALTEPPEPRPSILDGNVPSEEELMAMDLAMEADLKQVHEFLEADDKLNELWEKNKQLNHWYATSESRIASMMREKSECIKLCKKQQHHIKKLYEEREKCPFCKENYEKNRPFY
jgi:ParB-like chromosome segregation protein Spo0J